MGLRLSLEPRDVLDLGEDNFLWALVAAFPYSILLVGTVAALTWLAIEALFTRRVDRMDRCRDLCLSVFAGALFALWPMARNVPNPIELETEPDYLRFAAIARDVFSGIKESYASLDPENPDVANEVERLVKSRLEPLVPAYWPRRCLHVWVEEGCVVLSRGSGMLGEVGVRIYDKGAPVLYSEEQLRVNPHLPQQRKITDRLWFFKSD